MPTVGSVPGDPDGVAVSFIALAAVPAALAFKIGQRSS
jgi:hypothetical protein